MINVDKLVGHIVVAKQSDGSGKPMRIVGYAITGEWRNAYVIAMTTDGVICKLHIGDVSWKVLHPEGVK